MIATGRASRRIFAHCARRASTSARMAPTEELASLISSLPSTNIRASFAYGSGVVQQEGGNDRALNMVDFVIVTDDARRFHEANLKCNSSHYSFVKYAGPKRLAELQCDYGAGVFCNTMVTARSSDGRSRLIKYGVINEEDLLDDLNNWRHLYIAGRLQKSVVWTSLPPSSPLRPVLRTNHEHAIHAALLLLPSHFDRRQLYARIARHSYEGDVRMGIAEDSNKISNLVDGGFDRFDAVYAPLLSSMDAVLLRGDTECEQNVSPNAMYEHLNTLPSYLLHVLLANHHKVGEDAEDALVDMAYSMEDTQIRLRQALAHIVRTSSRAQTIKAALTAGLYKSVLYGGRKALKFVRSRNLL